MTHSRRSITSTLRGAMEKGRWRPVSVLPFFGRAAGAQSPQAGPVFFLRFFFSRIESSLALTNSHAPKPFKRISGKSVNNGRPDTKNPRASSTPGHLPDSSGIFLFHPTRTNAPERTVPATRISREAAVTAKEHERMVRTDFLFARELLFDGAVGFFGGFRLYDGEPVQYSVHVRIDADVGQIVEYRKHDLRGLDSHSRK